MDPKVRHDTPVSWLQSLGATPAPGAPSSAKTEYIPPVLKPSERPKRSDELAPWVKSAGPALAYRRYDGRSIIYELGQPVTFAVRRFAYDPDAWSAIPVRAAGAPLTSMVKRDASTIADTISRLLVTMQDVRLSDLGMHVANGLFRDSGLPLPAGVSIDTGAVFEFMAQHRDAIMEGMRAAIAERRTADVAEMTAALAANPHLSLHELWIARLAQRPRDTPDYFDQLRAGELAPLLTRAVDRMGDEPNYLLAAHFTNHLLAQSVGTSYAAAVKSFRDLLVKRGWLTALTEVGWKDFTTSEAQALIDSYVFVPSWPGGVKRESDANFDDLPLEMRARLEAISGMPLASELLLKQAALRGERDALRDSVLVTTEHALADKLDLFRHLIAHDGMRGNDIKVVWKEGSADPLVVELAERCFGIKGPIAGGTEHIPADKQLELLANERLEAAVHNAGGRVVNVHLQGVRSWHFVGELARAHPNVAINACSHTTSDYDELRTMPPGVERVALSVMASMTAKIRYERHVFTPTFERLLLDVDTRFEHELQTIRNRTFVVFGGAGRIIGTSVVDALKALDFKTAIVDPFLQTPKGAVKRQRLQSMGARILDTPEQVTQVLASERCFAINATAADVVSPASYRALGHDLITMNLGTGQKGFAMPQLEQLATTKRQLIGNKDDGHVRSFAYNVPGASGPVEVFALRNGRVFNLGERAANPRALSAFNNLLIVESLHQAKFNRARGQLGPQVLDAVRVAFSREDKPRPVVSFMRRDAIPAEWPLEWQGDPARDPHSAVIVTDETILPADA